MYMSSLDALAIPDHAEALADRVPEYLQQFPTEEKMAVEWAERESRHTLSNHRQTLSRLMVRSSAAGHDLVVRGWVFRNAESEDCYRALRLIEWRCLALHQIVAAELKRRDEERG